MRKTSSIKYVQSVTEMIKPCISNLGENDFFSFFVASKSDFVLTKFCMSMCKDVLLTKPCSPEHFTFLRNDTIVSAMKCSS